MDKLGLDGKPDGITRGKLRALDRHECQKPA
jgi:hypothetical protein